MHICILKQVFSYAWLHVEADLFPCMLHDEVACFACKGGRHEQAFRPARGPLRTGPYGPGPVGKLVGPGCNFRPEKMSVRSGL